MQRKKQGISIRIITSNEKSNMTLMSELESNFEVVKVPLKGAYLSNRLHDKFCIIDFEFVMHGSYNWSKAAQYELKIKWIVNEQDAIDILTTISFLHKQLDESFVVPQHIA